MHEDQEKGNECDELNNRYTNEESSKADHKSIVNECDKQIKSENEINLQIYQKGNECDELNNSYTNEESQHTQDENNKTEHNKQINNNHNINSELINRTEYLHEETKLKESQSYHDPENNGKLLLNQNKDEKVILAKEILLKIDIINEILKYGVETEKNNITKYFKDEKILLIDMKIYFPKDLDKLITIEFCFYKYIDSDQNSLKSNNIDSKAIIMKNSKEPNEIASNFSNDDHDKKDKSSICILVKYNLTSFIKLLSHFLESSNFIEDLINLKIEMISYLIICISKSKLNILRSIMNINIEYFLRIIFIKEENQNQLFRKYFKDMEEESKIIFDFKSLGTKDFLEIIINDNYLKEKLFCNIKYLYKYKEKYVEKDYFYKIVIENTKIEDLKYIFKIERFKFYDLIYAKIKNESILNKFELFQNIKNENEYEYRLLVNYEIKDDGQKEIILEDLKCNDNIAFMEKKIHILFKRLAFSTVDIIRQKIMEDYCFRYPECVIKCILDTVLYSDALIGVFISLINNLPQLFIEIFYFQTLKRLTSFNSKDILNENDFSKKYNNFVKFLLKCFLTKDKSMINDKDLYIPICNFSRNCLMKKNYLHISIIEAVMPHESILLEKYIKDAHVYVQKKKEINKRIRIEIADRYYKLNKTYYGSNADTSKETNIIDLKNLLPAQIEELVNKIDISMVVETFKKMDPDNENDYFVLRNIALFIKHKENFFLDELICGMESFDGCVRNDMRLLMRSCVSIMKIRKRNCRGNIYEKLIPSDLRKGKDDDSLSAITISRNICNFEISTQLQKKDGDDLNAINTSKNISNGQTDLSINDITNINVNSVDKNVVIHSINNKETELRKNSDCSEGFNNNLVECSEKLNLNNKDVVSHRVNIKKTNVREDSKCSDRFDSKNEEYNQSKNSNKRNLYLDNKEEKDLNIINTTKESIADKDLDFRNSMAKKEKEVYNNVESQIKNQNKQNICLNNDEKIITAAENVECNNGNINEEKSLDSKCCEFEKRVDKKYDDKTKDIVVEDIKEPFSLEEKQSIHESNAIKIENENKNLVEISDRIKQNIIHEKLECKDNNFKSNFIEQNEEHKNKKIINTEKNTGSKIELEDNPANNMKVNDRFYKEVDHKLPEYDNNDYNDKSTEEHYKRNDKRHDNYKERQFHATDRPYQKKEYDYEDKDYHNNYIGTRRHDEHGWNHDINYRKKYTEDYEVGKPGYYNKHIDKSKNYNGDYKVSKPYYYKQHIGKFKNYDQDYEYHKPGFYNKQIDRPYYEDSYEYDYDNHTYSKDEKTYFNSKRNYFSNNEDLRYSKRNKFNDNYERSKKDYYNNERINYNYYNTSKYLDNENDYHNNDRINYNHYNISKYPGNESQCSYYDDYSVYDKRYNTKDKFYYNQNTNNGNDFEYNKSYNKKYFTGNNEDFSYKSRFDNKRKYDDESDSYYSQCSNQTNKRFYRNTD